MKTLSCHRLEIESSPGEQELVKTPTTKTYTKSNIFCCHALLKREMIHVQLCFRNFEKRIKLPVCFYQD